MAHNRTSVVVLGNGDSLQKALITNILGKDLSQVSRKFDTLNNEIYEDDTYVVTCTADLKNSCEAIKELFTIKQHPDMCLLVVQEDFSTHEVWTQIQELSKTTGKPTEDFTVVPISYKHNYTFKFYTKEQIFGGQNKQTEDRHPTKKRTTADPESHLSAGGSCSNEHITDVKKTLKRKVAGTRVNLVLLGLAGTGKSASGNTILGQKTFKSIVSSRPVTTECQMVETQINGTHVRVIDTPDIFEDENQQSVRKNVTKCRELCHSEPCVYLLVMQLSRFTDGEKDILTKLENLFGNKAREQTLILFTHGDDLLHENTNMKQFLHDCQPNLKKIVEECGRRCVVFENKTQNVKQVEELMQTVEGMLNHQ